MENGANVEMIKTPYREVSFFSIKNIFTISQMHEILSQNKFGSSEKAIAFGKHSKISENVKSKSRSRF